MTSYSRRREDHPIHSRSFYGLVGRRQRDDRKCRPSCTNSPRGVWLFLAWEVCSSSPPEGSILPGMGGICGRTRRLFVYIRLRVFPYAVRIIFAFFSRIILRSIQQHNLPGMQFSPQTGIMNRKGCDFVFSGMFAGIVSGLRKIGRGLLPPPTPLSRCD